MLIDIIIITYNSQKWIRPCVGSIAKSDFNLQDISLVFVDNNSSDNTVNLLESLEKEYQNIFGNFQLIKNKANKGFGAANNLGAKLSKASAPYIFFLNADTELFTDTLQKLFSSLDNFKEEKIGSLECRQLPYEHPKFYDPLTFDTPWSSGAALLVSREAFIKTGMFDENIFMYAEDVDLSWRLFLNNYKVKYIPSARVNHYSYSEPGEVKPIQVKESIVNNIYLRFKFGTYKNKIEGYKQLFKLLIKSSNVSKTEILFSSFKKSFISIPKFIKNRTLHKGQLKKALQKGVIRFPEWDYSIRRKGDFYQQTELEISPLISIVVRTCGRPKLLKEALYSISNQTYRNFEVVVVEDGPPVSKELIENNFSHLNITYYYSNNKVGRSVNGNKGLSLASGDYLTFLDDDDVYFSDHLEVLVREIQKEPQSKVFYSLAFETPVTRDPKTYEYEVKDYILRYDQTFNRLLLFIRNYLPIQTVLFHRDVFTKLGGFDESIDFCEDWDLWMRYSLSFDFKYIDKITSIYRVPFHHNHYDKRQKELDSTLEYLSEKHKDYILSSISVSSLKSDLEKYLEGIYLSELPVPKKVLLQKIFKKLIS